MKSSDLWSFKKASLVIFLTTLLTSGSLGVGLLYWHNYKKERIRDDRYNIIAILQSSDMSESLQIDYLAELLELSIDRPTNLYAFNCKEGVKRLLSCPNIKYAEIQKVLPGMLHIKYSLRKPLVYLPEFANAALDEEGYLIPFQPFYTPKNIPDLYLGLEKGCFGMKIPPEKFELVLTLLNKFRSDHFRIKRLDITHSSSENFGKREIVVIEELSQKNGSRKCELIGRFSTHSWQDQLENYIKLKETIARQSKIKRCILDMRIAKIALLQEKF